MTHHSISPQTATCRLLLLAGCLLAPLPAQAGWDQLTPPQSPPARDGHGMAYDARRGVVVLYGGRDENGDLLDDLWEWNGWTWERRRPAGIVPPPLPDCRMSYDPIRGVTVLIGRTGHQGGYREVVGAYLWNGLGWSLNNLFQANGGGGGSYGLDLHLEDIGSFGFAFDPVRRRSVIASPQGRRDGRLHRAWHDGTQWTTELSAGPVFQSDVDRFPVALTFDPNITDQLCFVVACDRAISRDTRIHVARWGNGQWLPLHSEIVASGDLSSEFDLSVAFDSRRSAAVAFVTHPEHQEQNLLAEWDGTSWRQTPLPRGATGGALASGYAMAYDEARGELILFGGRNHHRWGDRAVGDTLRYVPVRGAFEPFGTGCAGSGGTPTLALGDPLPPRAGERMTVSFTGLPQSIAPVFVQLGTSNRTWAGLPLPLDLGFLGMPGCLWSISIDAGYVVPRFFGQATWSTVLPLQPGTEFFLQALVADSTANAAGYTVSNAARVIVGAR